MGYKDTVAESAKNANSGGNDDREEFEQIEVDMGNIPFVKFSPTTVVRGTFPEADEGNPIILFKNYERLNELGDRAEDDEGNDLRFVSTRYLGIVMDDIGALVNEEFEDAFLLETGDNDKTDYRIFDESDSETTVEPNFVQNEDGDPVQEGVEVTVKSDTWKGEKIEGEEAEEYIDRGIVTVSGAGAVSVARTLDVSGASPAGMDEETGQVNGGLIENVPDDVDAPDNQRYARPFVELRDDLFGETVDIMVARREEIDEDYAELVEQGDARPMYWFSVIDAETGEELERQDGEPTTYTYLVWGFDANVGPDWLDEQDYKFVEQYVENEMPTDEETIRTNLEKNSGDLSDDPNEDRMVELIQDMSE